MKAQVHHFCQESEDFEPQDIHIMVDLPFVPAAGTMLKVARDGEFMPVDEIYFDVKTPELLEVFISADDISLFPWEVMKAQGWVMS
jgi:hypothetical protein